MAGERHEQKQTGERVRTAESHAGKQQGRNRKASDGKGGQLSEDTRRREGKRAEPHQRD